MPFCLPVFQPVCQAVCLPFLFLSVCHFTACVFVWVFVCQLACLSVCLSVYVCLSTWFPPACLSVCLSVCLLSACVFVWIWVCLSVCLPGSRLHCGRCTARWLRPPAGPRCPGTAHLAKSFLKNKKNNFILALANARGDDKGSKINNSNTPFSLFILLYF